MGIYCFQFRNVKEGEIGLSWQCYDKMEVECENNGDAQRKAREVVKLLGSSVEVRISLKGDKSGVVMRMEA